jgi:hypothetical protein
LIIIDYYCYRLLWKVTFITLSTRAVTNVRRSTGNIPLLFLYFVRNCPFHPRQILVTPPFTKLDENPSSEWRTDGQKGVTRWPLFATLRTRPKKKKREFASYVARGRFARLYFMNKLASLMPHLPQDRESVPSFSSPNNQSFQQLSQCVLTFFCVLQNAAFCEVLQQKFCWYLMYRQPQHMAAHVRN